LKIYLGIAQNVSLFVHNSGTIRINQLIENNNKAIVRFLLNEIIEKIYKNYNLEEFSSCCQTLPSKKISEMAKFQRNLNYLKLIR
jgi:hypothetical protein